MASPIADLLPVVVKRSRRQDALSFVGSMIAAGIGGYFLVEHGFSWSPGMVCLFFLSGASYFAQQFCNRKPRLIISEDGINVDYWNSMMMPWSEFKAVSVEVVGKSEYLCLFLNDPDNYRRHAGMLRRGFHTATRETSGCDLMVNLSELGMDAAKTVALIERLLEVVRTNPKPPSAVKYIVPE
jgi:hypothetical protein